MHLSPRTGLAMVVLAAAAVATWYWSRPQPAPQAQPARSPIPMGYYLRDALFLGTGENGEVLYELAAQQVEEQPNEGRLLLNAVRLEYRPAAQVPWRVRAASAEAPMDGSVLLLQGEVELLRESDEGGQPTVIQTENLRLEIEAFVAHTEDHVTVIMDGERLRAVGATAYLKDDRLELESEVHGQFVP